MGRAKHWLHEGNKVEQLLQDVDVAKHWFHEGSRVEQLEVVDV